MRGLVGAKHNYVFKVKNRGGYIYHGLRERCGAIRHPPSAIRHPPSAGRRMAETESPKTFFGDAGPSEAPQSPPTCWWVMEGVI